MPIYEYACLDCQHAFEELSSYAERAASRLCPNCTSPRVKPLFSRVAMLSGSDEPSPGAAAGCGCGGACACRAN